MSEQDHRAPGAPVEQPPRGFNGLPELEDLGVVAPTDVAAYTPAPRLPAAGGWAAGWAAVAAIAVPVAIAAWTLRRRRRQTAERFGGGATQHHHDALEFTPPHGDKLLFRPDSGQPAAPGPRRAG